MKAETLGKKNMKYKDIPTSWLVALFIVGMIVMRCFGIDTWVTATLGSLVGYVLGKHIEQTKHPA